MKTAEEFFKNKIKEQSPNIEIVALSQELITAEQGMLWAHEFKQLHLHDVSNSFTAEEVVNELEDCDTLDDAIMFFKEYENKQCPIPVVRRNIFLWMEGFAATGQRQGASMIGTYEATDLDDAVKQYMETHKGYVDWDRFGRGRHAIWGCEIFDNEEEARKSFG